MYFTNYGIVTYYVILCNYALIMWNWTFVRKHNEHVISSNAEVAAFLLKKILYFRIVRRVANWRFNIGKIVVRPKENFKEINLIPKSFLKILKSKEVMTK